MSHRDPDDGVIARWSLEASARDAFLREVRAQANRPGGVLPQGDAAAWDGDVVVAREALQVGRERIDLASFHVHVVVDHGTWLELRDADSDYYARPLPLPGDALLAALVREHLLALAAANTAESDLRMAEYEAERRRPTASNRVLWFVERHFIACLLATFFVVLPLVALLAAWLFGP